MYEHPIKRAGLTFNRILFSNTRMVQACFPKSAGHRYDLHFTMKTFENGKEVKRQCKFNTSIILAGSNILSLIIFHFQYLIQSSHPPIWTLCYLSLLKVASENEQGMITHQLKDNSRKYKLKTIYLKHNHLAY